MEKREKRTEQVERNSEKRGLERKRQAEAARGIERLTQRHSTENIRHLKTHGSQEQKEKEIQKVFEKSNQQLKPYEGKELERKKEINKAYKREGGEYLKTSEIQGKSGNDKHFRSEAVKVSKIGVEVDRRHEHQVRVNDGIGKEREKEIRNVLEKRYPKEEGYKIYEQRVLKNEDEKRAEVNKKWRKLDYVVTKDDKVVKSIEVTSEKANKESQLSKEKDIRDKTPVFISDSDTGKLISVPKDVETEVWRIE